MCVVKVRPPKVLAFADALRLLFKVSDSIVEMIPTEMNLLLSLVRLLWVFFVLLNQKKPQYQLSLQPPDSIYRNSNFIIIKHTTFKLDRNKIKLAKTSLVFLSTVPTITNFGSVALIDRV